MFTRLNVSATVRSPYELRQLVGHASGRDQATRRYWYRAIEAYRTRNGKVPSDLKELQPDFLREIPQPTVGKKSWTLQRNQSNHSYNLEVAIRRFEAVCRHSQREGGLYDTK